MTEIAEFNPWWGQKDQYYMSARQTRCLPYYELSEDRDRLQISDPIWGETEIGDWVGDDIFIRLYQHPLVTRLSGVEQLTLPIRYATMPNTTELSRWEHAFGSLILARKLIEQSGRQFSDREKIIYQLRTFLSDVGHTAFSHLGDWLQQGFGGNEDHHDKIQRSLLEMGGIDKILLEHGIELDELFNNDADWVERPGPDLCIDNVDYGLREIDLWVPVPINVDLKNAFFLDGNQIVMKDHQTALCFAISYGLLATEHWSQPLHRQQLNLFGNLIKGAIVDNGSPILSRYRLKHPLDLLYTVDSDILEGTHQVGALNNDLNSLMLDLARHQRRIFSLSREDEIGSFLSSVGPERPERGEVDFIKPLETQMWKGEYIGVKPPNIEFLPVAGPEDLGDFNQLPHTLDTYLPALKLRTIDPQFYNELGQVVRLSEVDPVAARLIEQHKAIQAQSYVGRTYLAPDFAQALKQKLKEIELKWAARYESQRVDPRVLSQAIRSIGSFALLSHRHIQGNDEFLTL